MNKDKDGRVILTQEEIRIDACQAVGAASFKSWAYKQQLDIEVNNPTFKSVPILFPYYLDKGAFLAQVIASAWDKDWGLSPEEVLNSSEVKAMIKKLRIKTKKRFTESVLKFVGANKDQLCELVATLVAYQKIPRFTRYRVMPEMFKRPAK